VIVQTEMSLYRLGTDLLGESIDLFLDEFSNRPLEVTTGPMSTLVVGEVAVIFNALSAAFAGAAENGPAVLVVKISNACPLGAAPD
jgi:uncharacterized protein YqgV (UPF0045/DUF77 family)